PAARAGEAGSRSGPRPDSRIAPPGPRDGSNKPGIGRPGSPRRAIPAKFGASSWGGRGVAGGGRRTGPVGEEPDGPLRLLDGPRECHVAGGSLHRGAQGSEGRLRRDQSIFGSLRVLTPRSRTCRGLSTRLRELREPDQGRLGGDRGLARTGQRGLEIIGRAI